MYCLKLYLSDSNTMFLSRSAPMNQLRSKSLVLYIHVPYDIFKICRTNWSNMRVFTRSDSVAIVLYTIHAIL
jgi:hypothetical protein